MATSLSAPAADVARRVGTIVTTRILELDGLRGCAILLVLLFHCGTFPSTTLPSRLLRLATGVSLGWSGVDLFFVLSGFLITGILLETKGCENFFRSFYARRVLRIFPLYLTVVAVFFWTALPLAHAFGHGLAMHSSAQIWYWLYLSNWRVGLGLTHEDYLNHFWSLAIEEQFYLVWPALVALLTERQLARLCVGLLAGCLLLRCALVTTLPSAAINFLTPFRIDTLACGALVCILARHAASAAAYRRHSRLVLAASGVALAGLVLLAGAISVEHVAIRTVGYTLLAVFFGTLIFQVSAAAGSSGRFVQLLRQPFLRSFGKYSYAIYILHMPVYILTRQALTHWAEAHGRSYNALFAYGCVLICTLISYGLARVSWVLLEQPFLRLKSRFPYCVESPA